MREEDIQDIYINKKEIEDERVGLTMPFGSAVLIRSVLENAHISVLSLFVLSRLDVNS